MTLYQVTIEPREADDMVFFDREEAVAYAVAECEDIPNPVEDDDYSITTLSIADPANAPGFTAQVREFTTACKDEDEVSDRPVRLPIDRVDFIREMVQDEMDELSEADNITDQADALVDAIYYICDTAATHGINLDPLFAIVHGANMQKVVEGKVIRNPGNGKIEKPEGWVAPEPLLEAEIGRQLDKGGFQESS